LASPQPSWSDWAEVDLIAFLQSRYLGLKAFGEVYGYLFAIFMLGSGLGPFLMGQSFKLLHSYDPALMVMAGGLVLACILMARLGAYAFGARSGADGVQASDSSSSSSSSSPLATTAPSVSATRRTHRVA
jgi:hypothetical protein